jgi:ankyrin repeat protein
MKLKVSLVIGLIGQSLFAMEQSPVQKNTRALFCAIIGSNLQDVKQALLNDFNPNETIDSLNFSNYGINPALFHRSEADLPALFFAIQRKSSAIIRLLCLKYPYLANKEFEGETPLTFAAHAKEDHDSPTKALLDSGAQRNNVNNQIKTPYEIACIHQNYKIAAALKQGTNGTAIANGNTYLNRDFDIE